MRVVICINTSWNIYNFRSGLIRALLSEDHEVVAVAPPDEFTAKLEEMGCQFHPIEINHTGSNPLKDLKLYFQLKKAYRETKPDIIFQYTVKPNIYGSLAARSLNIPVINNVSGLGTVFLNNGLTSSIAKLLYRISFQRVNLVFFQNANDRSDFLEQISLPKLKTDLLPGSGINLNLFKTDRPLCTQPFSFLMIARLILDKGLVEYLDAARQLKKKHPNVIFLLLGQLDETHARGISKEKLDHYIEDGSIDYLGTNDDVKPIIEKCSCVVLPSYREGTPKTLLEAAALQRPIVTTDVPGCREVVMDKSNGLLCEVMNSVDLEKKMEAMILTETNELEEMGKKGRALIEERFDENIIIRKYMNAAINILK